MVRSDRRVLALSLDRRDDFVLVLQVP